jgi:hypothetical protein
MTQSAFVSSTFVDLEAHRRHARDAITKLELTFKAMEFFAALPGTPKEECLQLVRASSIFVGIIGMRYGVIDPIDGKSMTQLEYEEAQAARLPTLMYLIDEDHHPVLPKHVDTGAGVELRFIQPGKPMQNAYIESFNSRFRDECLSQHWFASLSHVRSVIDNWREDYNHHRPHSTLGYVPPAVFAARCRQHAGGNAQTPASTTMRSPGL